MWELVVASRHWEKNRRQVSSSLRKDLTVSTLIVLYSIIPTSLVRTEKWGSDLGGVGCSLSAAGLSRPRGLQFCPLASTRHSQPAWPCLGRDTVKLNAAHNYQNSDREHCEECVRIETLLTSQEGEQEEIKAKCSPLTPPWLPPPLNGSPDREPGPVVAYLKTYN